MTRLRSFQIDLVELGPALDPFLGGGALNDLSDTTIVTPLNGEVLTYNSTSSQWENTTHVAGVTDHLLLSNIGTNTHAQIDTAITTSTNHIADATIHFTEANINHANITGAGANTHAQIDTHIAGTALQHVAANITYDDTISTLLGGGSPAITEVQTAIEALSFNQQFKNTSHTGVVNGGFITSPTTTTFSISDGDGVITDALANPGSATGQVVSWAGLTGITLSQDVSGSGVTYIFISNAGTVVQFLTKPTNKTFVDNIFLGVAFYEASLIAVVFNEPHVVDSTAANFLDYVAFMGTNINGLTPIAIGAGVASSSLEFFVSSGKYYSPGINWHTDRYDANIISIAANGVDNDGPFPAGTGAVFDYILGDGTISAATQTVLDSTIYDDGTSTPGIPLAKNGIIHFIVQVASGKTYVQPHTQTYRDWKAANSSVQSALSNFVLADAIKEGFIVGAYVGEFGESSWERGDKASLVGFGTGGSASSTTASSEFVIDLTTGVGSPLGITDTLLPPGWTTTYNSAGNFTLTHSLGDTTVGFALNVLYNGGARVINPTSISTNTIVFQISDMADAAVEGNVIGKLLF